MGSSTILDIITSVVIAGFLLLTALRLNDQANETSILYHSNLSLQQNMTALTGILEHDFRRIGFCADYKKIKDPADAIRYADTSKVRFWLDLDNDGVLNFPRESERLLRFSIDMSDPASYDRIGGCIPAGDARLVGGPAKCWVHFRVPFASAERIGSPVLRRIMMVPAHHRHGVSQFVSLGLWIQLFQGCLQELQAATPPKLAVDPSDLELQHGLLLADGS